MSAKEVFINKYFGETLESLANISRAPYELYMLSLYYDHIMMFMSKHFPPSNTSLARYKLLRELEKEEEDDGTVSRPFNEEFDGIKDEEGVISKLCEEEITKCFHKLDYAQMRGGIPGGPGYIYYHTLEHEADKYQNQESPMKSEFQLERVREACRIQSVINGNLSIHSEKKESEVMRVFNSLEKTLLDILSYLLDTENWKECYPWKTLFKLVTLHEHGILIQRRETYGDNFDFDIVTAREYQRLRDLLITKSCDNANGYTVYNSSNDWKQDIEHLKARYQFIKESNDNNKVSIYKSSLDYTISNEFNEEELYNMQLLRYACIKACNEGFVIQ